MGTEEQKYRRIIEEIFFTHYRDNMIGFDFEREEILEASKKLGIKPPKNPGDVLYSYRFRKSLPDRIVATAPLNKEWIILLAGIGKYRFRIVNFSRITPQVNQLRIKIPDSTPEIIAKHAMNDEQALLAKVRYNRLIDIFLGIATFSLQSHLRTSLVGIGQIEIDEIYIGVNRKGAQFIVPVQAKSGKDQISIVQTDQDLLFCQNRFPSLVCRPISVQFLSKDIIVMFELIRDGEEICIVDEKHYQLVPGENITDSDLQLYQAYE